MARADRIQAGDPFISAGNLNKVIEQSNRLDGAQGGQGLGVTNDETGFLVQNLRRKLRPDGDSPYDSSDPWRRTLRRNTSDNRHQHELEMWNSTIVTGITKNSFPQSSHMFPSTSLVKYGVPSLVCLNSSVASSTDGRGSGELAWHQMDGDFPFGLVSSGDLGPSSSSPYPQRKTLRRRGGTTIYRNSFELYNSDTVSDNGRDVTSSVPGWYGIPFLPVDEDGSGDLTWNIMDADRTGTNGPRSLERRTTSGLDVFQLYDFDALPVTLTSSDIFEFVVRRDYGTSTANHYIQYLNSSALADLVDAISLPEPGDPKPEPPGSSSEIGTSDKGARADHVHRAPRWDEILNAEADTYMVPDDVDSSLDLFIGAQSFQEWTNIKMWATDLIEIKTVEAGGTTTIGNDPGHLMTITSSEIRVHNVASPILNLDSATGALHVNDTQVVSARLGAVSAPSGGATIDSQARTAINTIISRLVGHGLIAST